MPSAGHQQTLFRTRLGKLFFLRIEATAKPRVPHLKCHRKKERGSWKKPEARNFSNRHGSISGLLRWGCQSSLWLDVDWGK